MGSAPNAEWQTWLPSPTISMGSFAYGAEGWRLASQVGTTSVNIYGTQDARRTDAWPLIGSIGSTSYTTMTYGNGYWVLYSGTGIAYSTNGFASVTTTNTVPCTFLAWNIDRWVRIASGIAYTSTSSPTGPWTSIGNAAAIGFTPNRVAWNGEQYMVMNQTITGVSGGGTVQPHLAVSSGDGSWTTVYNALGPGSSGVNRSGTQLRWCAEQSEWVALWSNTTFNSWRLVWSGATGSSWTEITLPAPGNQPAGANITTGNGWQFLTTNNGNSAFGYGYYRKADSWGDSTSWSLTTTASLQPVGITGLRYGDGYWVAVHDNSITTNATVRISASTESDDSYWGISLDDWN